MAIDIHQVEIFPDTRTIVVHYSGTYVQGVQRYSFKYVKKSAGGLTVQSMLRSIEDNLLESGMSLL